MALWGGVPFLASHNLYSCLLTHVSAREAGWAGLPVLIRCRGRDGQDSGLSPGRCRVEGVSLGMALRGPQSGPPKPFWRRSACLRRSQDVLFLVLPGCSVGGAAGNE